MNKVMRRCLILLALFVAALISFSRVMNHETADLTTDMASPTLPVVYFEYNDRMVNELHGYVQEMDAVSMRDTITPIGDDGKMSVLVDSYGQKIESLSYEVRSLDAARLIQESEAEISAEESSIHAQLTIGNLIGDGTEYLLILALNTEKTSYYYYTRIIRDGEAHVQECLDFVEEFHGLTMDKKKTSKLADYMEPSSQADNSTLQKVTLHNKLSQASWADFDGAEATDAIASVKEINPEYLVILLNYIMSSVGEDGQSEYYNVEEYYRVRYGTKKMYLLDFERTVEEIFRSDGGNIQGSSIDLGIRSADVDFKTNGTGMLTCFVQQGELWSYNLDENRLSQVFSFRSAEGMDARENYGEHDIRIVRSDEGGSVDFIVYGYMNRGEHEGEVGVSVCHYDGVLKTVEERLFIPSTVSFQMLKERLGQMMYISDSGIFYFMIGQQVHRVDLKTPEDAVLIPRMSGSACAASDDGRYLAWTEEDTAQVMHLTDLETEETYDVNAPEGGAVCPMGFVGTDCIYGTSGERNPAASGENIPFMVRQVSIMDADSHEVLKTYKSSSALVTGIEIEDGSISLKRVKKKGDSYTETSGETILNRDMQEKELVYVSERESKTKQREIVLQLPGEVPKTAQKFIVSKQIVPKEPTGIELKESGIEPMYYVYAKGKILFASNNVTEAVRCADENGGLVADKTQLCVWSRGRRAYRSRLSVKGLPTGRKMSCAELTAAMPERIVYNLAGCTLDQVLYFVGAGWPVYVNSGSSAKLIVGYDSLSVSVYDTASKKVSSIRIKEAQETFADSGNVFYCAVSK